MPYRPRHDPMILEAGVLRSVPTREAAGTPGSRCRPRTGSPQELGPLPGSPGTQGLPLISPMPQSQAMNNSASWRTETPRVGLGPPGAGSAGGANPRRAKTSATMPSPRELGPCWRSPPPQGLHGVLPPAWWGLTAACEGIRKPTQACPEGCGVRLRTVRPRSLTRLACGCWL